jgi:uncharacterized SAM-binding protein YcdF (DUF218 family)
VLDDATAVAFALFLVGTVRDPRRFRNAVLLGLTFVLLGLDLLHRLATVHRAPPRLLEAGALLVVALTALGVLALGFLLIANGVQMVRREGLRPQNLLSLLAGLGILGCVLLFSAAVATRSPLVVAVAGAVLPVVGYVSFLFLCFLAYAFLYSRLLPTRRRVDFVVVLGSGLVGGSRVPPLLASRLERGRALYARQAARGKPPVLITSGGQGPDEELPEAWAMADFVVVLGAGLHDGDRVPPLLASRLDRARRVYQALAGRREASPLLIVSGGQGHDERISEAEAMARYLIERGVPADHVLREDRSRTTEENLRFSHAIMSELKPDYRCLVVTNNFHVFRAALTARRTGVRGQVIGAPTAAYFWPNATIREFAAVFLHHKVLNLGLCLLLGLSGLAAAP